MAYEEIFELNGEKIKTTVTYYPKDILNHLSSFLLPSINHQTKLIGFDAECLPNITFVGVGIKENLARLEKHYGIGCKNAVELGPLAATVMNMPQLSLCGVDELAFVVNGFDLQDHRPVTLSYDYADYRLSKELVKVATVNVYSYHKIGVKLSTRTCKCCYR
ncbi:werner syndrome-like exonuclease-like protein [Trifolium pratense]|uniref:Werner syndrome-like exonuclease-like protein n=1 Tax=Trifolium pratense TaxID=57577 RepID=A0A2K3MX18_TRIPR|nr:werner syndrome-like exonuclease-like protein [Trifolium pratense]